MRSRDDDGLNGAGSQHSGDILGFNASLESDPYEVGPSNALRTVIPYHGKFSYSSSSSGENDVTRGETELLEVVIVDIHSRHRFEVKVSLLIEISDSNDPHAVR